MSDTADRNKPFPDFQITIEESQTKWAAHVISDPSKLTPDQSAECFADAAFVPEMRDWALDRLWTAIEKKRERQEVSS